MRRPVPFCGGMHISRSPQTSSQECINWYPQVERLSDGTQRIILLPTPGLNLYKDMPNAPAEIRGSILFDSDAWIVSGNKLYQLTAALAATERGTLATNSGQVSIIASETQIAIVDGVSGYVWDAGSETFAAISDPEFPYGAQRLSYLDGYAIVEAPDSDIWQISANGDFREWDGLDFARIQSKPGSIIAHIADHGDLFFFKETSAEVWRDTGNADFPFERTADHIEFGIVSAHAVAQLDNTIFFVGAQSGASRAVWRMNGYTPQRVSTHSEEMMLGELEDVTDLFVYGYQQEGHSFLVITSDSGNWTIVYDVASGLWHQRAYYNVADGSLNRHRGNCYVFFNGRHLVGDFELGRLYSLDLDTFEDYTGVVKRVRSGPPIGNGRDRMFFPFFGLQIEAGVGKVSCPDPQMALEYSDDGGRTWSDPVNAPMGAVGEYNAWCEWHRTGAALLRVFRVSTTDPVRAVIRGAYL